jgi:cobalt-zinc-cadmium efflux system outer membrane protein
LFQRVLIAAATAAALVSMQSVPAHGQDVPLVIPQLEARAKAEAEPRAAQAPEPIPLPPVESPFRDDELELTLADAESAATANHPALREAEGLVRAAYGNWVQVGLKPNPEIGYSGEEIGDSGKAGQQGGFISQEFVTGGKLDLNRAVALRERSAAEQRFQQVRLQVTTTVRKYYFEVVAAERAVMLTQQLSEIAAQSAAASQKLLDQAEVPKTSLLQSQIESESATLQVEQATERLAAARRRLAIILGSPERAPAKLEDVLARPLPDLNYETIRDRILAESPELSELRLAVDRARWEVQRASAGRVPNVNMQAGVQFDNASQDTIANVQVGMPIPIFNRNQGAIAQACGELAAAQAALEARELAIVERLAAAMRDYTTARQRVSRYTEKILPAAAETLRLTNSGYQQGELDYLQVLSVQQTYAAKNLSYLADLETAWKQWAEIDGFMVGDVSSVSIDRNRQSLENKESWK